MKRVRTRMFVLLGIFLLAAAAANAQAPAEQRAAVVEHGKFTLHKFEQPIGEETYEITRDGASLVAKIDFKFVDRGSPVPLSVTFRCAPDLTPQAFEIKGNTSRFSKIDQAVEVQPGKARLRNHEQWTETTAPDKFFTIAGYSPATMQMLLVRYWATHGSPAELAMLPGGRVKVEPRGEDTITVDSKPHKLTRYTVEGLIWGRETLWFDADRSLVAAVTLDAEFDHFEALRDGYESALGTLVTKAAADNMAALAEISKKIAGSRADLIAITGGTLIDGTGSAPVPDSVVVIKDGRVLAAGPRAKIKVPKKAKVIDAHGKFVLPGLWDMHAHFEQVEWGPIYLAAGVTTVRDVGNELEFITSVRDTVAAGHGLGPRILAAGVVDGSGPLALGVERVDTPEQARMWVNRYHDAGFQQMKIYSSVKLDELKAVTAEAHRLGMTVTGHIPIGITTYEAVEAGQDQINHIDYITAMIRPPSPKDATREQRLKATANLDLDSPEAHKAVAFLVEHHTVVDPTMALFELFSANTSKPAASFEPGAAKVPQELSEQINDVGPPTELSPLVEQMLQKDLAIIGMLHKAGVPIVAGTDQAVPGHSLHREIELYVQAGFTPMEAIQAATLVPAKVMGIERETGTLEAGKRGDVILVNGDPLQDIHNLRNVESVITNGQVYDTGELWKSVGFKP